MHHYYASYRTINTHAVLQAFCSVYKWKRVHWWLQPILQLAFLNRWVYDFPAGLQGMENYITILGISNQLPHLSRSNFVSAAQIAYKHKTALSLMHFLHRKLKRIRGTFILNKGLPTWKKKWEIHLWINIWIGQWLTSSSAKFQTQDAKWDNEWNTHSCMCMSYSCKTHKGRGCLSVLYTLIIKFQQEQMSASGIKHWVVTGRQDTNLHP